MPNIKLTPDQLTKLSEISNPLVRQRFSVFYQLPQDLQESILAEKTAESIWDLIKNKYKLSENSISATARIIGLIFLGEIPIKNFIAALQRDLKVDVKTAQAIAQDINMAIFQPVRESLMAIHNISDTNTRMQANNNPNPKYEARNPKQITNPNVSNNNQINVRMPATQPVQTDNNEEARRGREEALNKIRTQPPNQARPAMLRIIPNKNVVDLRVLAKKRHNNKKNHYDGFFTA